MNGRLALALALALALPAAAGCLQTPDFLQSAKMEASALAHRGAADEAAAAWNADAKLAGVGSIETSEHPSEADMDGDGTSEDDIPQDPDVGNGLARVWWYAYTAQGADGEELVRVWRVASDGTVELQEDHGFGADLGATGLALEGWATDSHESMAAAKTNGTFLNAIAGENATVVHVLANEEGATVWHVIGVSRSGIAIAMVDAASGELIDVRSLDLGGFMMPKTEGFTPYTAPQRPYVDMTQKGELAPGESDEFPFTVPADAEGMIHFASRSDMPMESIWWAILDDDGDVVAEGYGRNGFWGDREAHDELELVAGDYLLRVGTSGWGPMGPVDFTGTEYALRLFLAPPGVEMHEDDEYA